MTATRETFPARGAGREYLSAVLGLALDERLSGRSPSIVPPGHPWDTWWLRMRSGDPYPPTGGEGACPACAALVCDLARVPVGAQECQHGCHRVWAEAMRTPLRNGALPAPPQRLTVAMLKPGAPRTLIRTRLATTFEVVHTVERHLTAGDCDRLYPDAYGAAFLADRTAYLTAGTVLVMVLAGGEDAIGCGAVLKRRLRDELGAGPLRNHLHLADNPGEALADIALLAGAGTAAALYRRRENDDGRRDARLAYYRDRLEGRPGAAGVAATGRIHAAATTATRR